MMRLFNILVAIIALTLLAPVLLIIPLLIKLDDGGPVFFKQQRLGLHKIPFTVWKFRTMKDQEITRVGAYLRATALDEFLQFFSILRGQMSIVGPRPLTQSDVTRLGWDTEEYSQRWDVIPGLTGLVQIYGGTSAEHSLELERHYLLHQKFRLDLKIVILSAGVVILGKRRTKRWFPLQKDRVTPSCIN